MDAETTRSEIQSIRELQAFIALERRARSAETVSELAFIVANETISLIHFAQAAVLEADGTVLCLSGVSLPDERSPFSQFLIRLSRKLPPERESPVKVDKADLVPTLSDEWDNWLAPYALWVPAKALGWHFLIARDKPFTALEISWLSSLSEVFRHAREALDRRRSWKLWRGSTIGLKALAVGVVTLLLAAPVNLTVLAPAEIVPTNPIFVRSSIDAVIDKIYVQPNEAVEAGDRLVDLDTTTISSKLDVATKDLVAAQAEYRQTMQLALSDSKVRIQLASINGRIEVRSSEVAYLKAMLEKARLSAPVSGIAIFEDPAELVGRPMSIGERIIILAQEKDVEIEAWVGLADAIELPQGAKATLVLNATPVSPVYGHVRYMSYEAQVRPDGTTGYRLRATLANGTSPPRLGMRGTLRLEGHQVNVAYWLLRRPLSVMRQFIGL